MNIEEARNINLAVRKYLASKPGRRLAPFDFAWCLQLHREMFGNVWDWAGQIRTRDLNIGVPFHRISGDLQQLLDDLHSWPGFGWEVIEQATHLHHRAVRVHPLVDGNGRWGRMLANIWLKQHGAPVIVWPEDTIGSVSTILDEYLRAIRAADEGDYALLHGLHRQHVQR